MMENINNIVVSTRVRLARNLKDIPFPARLKGSPKSSEKVINTVTSVCDKLFNYDLLQMNKISDIDRIALLERHLISPNLAANTENGAVCIGKDNGMSIMINEEDHIRAQCFIRGFGLEECFKKVNAFDDKLSEMAQIAYDDKLGYLTACPTNLGTGMRASVMMFLPGLTICGELGGIINEVQQAGLTVRGIYGEGSKASGYLYQISNQITIGVSEVNLLKIVTNAVMKICEREQSARLRIYNQDKIALEDTVSRSFGILLYAKRITSEEFMEHMAKVKLGVALGILDLSMPMLNQLTELCQPANMCHYCGRNVDANERDIKRADLVRNKIQER